MMKIQQCEDKNSYIEILLGMAKKCDKEVPLSNERKQDENVRKIFGYTNKKIHGIGKRNNLSIGHYGSQKRLSLSKSNISELKGSTSRKNLKVNFGLVSTQKKVDTSAEGDTELCCANNNDNVRRLTAYSTCKVTK